MIRKVLIVDDTATNRIILKEMLGSEYGIIEAANGETALEILDKGYKTISAVLLDIGLPGIDGYEVLKSIRSDKRFSEMPVIMITASDDETTRVKSLALKANDFVTKPYNPDIIKHCLKNNIERSEAALANAEHDAKEKHGPVLSPAFSLRRIVVVSCILSLLISLGVQHFSIQSDLRTSCRNVAVDFSEIMDSYQRSFRMFELLLQQEIETADSIDEIEAFLKAKDKRLLDIEGGDYDGVYMYYQGRYMYSWDTPYSAYAETGYDATKRPWYIGAVQVDGDIFFSTPYPSYANDYMLATISRLQEDGETVIAYDIKLGEIGKYVDKLNLYKGALALICDAEGNIIGSTNHLYLGGKYTASSEELNQAVSAAWQEVEAGGAKQEAAEKALESALAKQQFAIKEGEHLQSLLENKGVLRYSFANFSIGYAHTNQQYTCFVITPITTFLPEVVILWAALSFALIALGVLVKKMLNRNHQILSDVLTGLNNRRAFMKYCDNHIQHHAGESLGLLMLDLNHFKRINDLYGHTIGDQALLDTAGVLKSACGTSEDNYFLCRYGGDEFLLAARIADVAAMESMKALIAEGFQRKNQTSMTPYILEASMGTSCGICRDKKSLEHLLTQADQAMYEEKKKLGNEMA